MGGAAAKAAFEGVTGQMVALKRISNSPYQCTTDCTPSARLQTLEKKVPLSWMNENHTPDDRGVPGVRPPLIQAELTPLYIARSAPPHLHEESEVVLPAFDFSQGIMKARPEF